jgi:hypothetical protein
MNVRTRLGTSVALQASSNLNFTLPASAQVPCTPLTACASTFRDKHWHSLAEVSQKQLSSLEEHWHFHDDTPSPSLSPSPSPVLVTVLVSALVLAGSGPGLLASLRWTAVPVALLEVGGGLGTPPLPGSHVTRRPSRPVIWRQPHCHSSWHRAALHRCQRRERCP